MSSTRLYRVARMHAGENARAGDRAGRNFWDNLWSTHRHAREVGANGLKHHEAQFARLFDRAFKNLGTTQGKKLLEIGAGDSGWLPYFAKRWGFAVSGLDYSSVGCAHAQDLARAAGVQAEVIFSDFFTPPPETIGAFDVLVSMGVVEHYDQTAEVLSALRRFVRPGGIIVTTVPNIPGLSGSLLKRVNRHVYDTHVPLDAEALRKAHTAAGLDIVSSEYVMSMNLGVAYNLSGLNPKAISTWLKKLLLIGGVAFSRFVWLMERVFRPLPVRPSLSPFIAIVARVPEHSTSR